MKIKLVCVGKTMSNYLIVGESEYLKRLQHYCPVEKIEIPELKNAKKLREDQIKQEEGKLILSKVNDGDQLILLDERGKKHSSKEFSNYLQKRLNQGGKSIIIVVGGAYGFSDEIYTRATGKISLSDMTFSHQMVRLFFLEQLYRAFTILKGEPYHHE
jgi:23S rRNA (pseudouridine1915-N3)-methyltransferase